MVELYIIYIFVQAMMLKEIKKLEIMENLSKETKTEVAMKMVLMDAIEKGHTNQNDLIEYMKSEVFETAVRNYISMFN